MDSIGFGETNIVLVDVPDDVAVDLHEIDPKGLQQLRRNQIAAVTGKSKGTAQRSQFSYQLLHRYSVYFGVEPRGLQTIVCQGAPCWFGVGPSQIWKIRHSISNHWTG